MIEQWIAEWIAETKKHSEPTGLGMILIHNGIVRATSKEGGMVKGMHLLYDKEKLNSLITDFRKKEGILATKV